MSGNAHADTGNGASVAFVEPVGSPASLSNWLDNLKIRSISFSEEAVERIESSTLSTSVYRDYISSDLTDPPQVTMTILFPTRYEAPAPGTNLGTMTITLPMRTGETVAASIAGTCFLGAKTLPTLQNGTLQEMTIRIDFDGDTGPTFTKSTFT